MFEFGDRMLLRKEMRVWIALFLYLGSLNHSLADERTETAVSMIEEISTTASSVLSSRQETLDERERNFHSILKKKIDFPFMSPLVMGAYWFRMNEEQKLEFTALFSDFFLNSYASQFGGYPGEKVRVKTVHKNGPKDVFVRLQLKRPGQRVSISEWRIREFAGIPKIIDVAIAGTSVVISHRKGFHEHLNKKGVEGLLTLLRIRADRISAQP